MNVDIAGDTDKEVTSKYFSNNPMDESLSDFQETKTRPLGPKSSKTVVKKPRKPAKKPKGQRDIRTALKAKKNDIVDYTEKFDAACKKAGVDVDTEELQLAIALSKSLQTETSECDDSPKKISSQERIKNIRTTLQEYGFKVPETKITTVKKIKKHKKDYKLISKSVVDKDQIISNKYSQVLFSNVDDLNSSDEHIDVSNLSLFNIATNISYKYIKSRDVFYVENLVEKSFSNGSLLRDWDKIPGRPTSPKLTEDITMDFSEIECSQEELDAILSGPVTNIRKILNWNRNEQKPHTYPNGKKTIDKPIEYSEVPHIVIEANEENKHVENKSIPDDDIEINEENISNEKRNVKSKVIEYRSCSPDIFEDEESVIDCLPIDITLQEKAGETMDLTECVNDILPKNHQTTNTNMSLRNLKNVTKRKSNDFMEITECVATSSQPIYVNIECTKSLYDKETKVKEQNDAILDLTQSSNSLDSLPEVHFDRNEDLDDTVILSADDYKGIKFNNIHATTKTNTDDIYDLTQDEEIKPKNNDNNVSGNVESHKDIKQISVADHDTKECENRNAIDSITVATGYHVFDENNLSTEKTLSKLENVDLSQPLNSSVTETDRIKETIALELNNSNDSDNTVLLPLDDTNCNELTPDTQHSDMKIKFDEANEGSSNENHAQNEDNLDLTQSSNSSIQNREQIFDMYSFDHSLNTSSNKDQTIPVDVNKEFNNLSHNSINTNRDKIEDVVESSKGNNENIDLTQSSNSSIEKMDICDNCSYSNDRNDKSITLEEHNLSPRRSTPSKIDNIENEIIDAEQYNKTLNSVCQSPIKADENIIASMESSQNPEIFEIVDCELDYSLIRSRRENYYGDEVEILDDNPNANESDNSVSFDGSLPIVYVKGSAEKVRPCTPKKSNNERFIETPGKTGYIISYDITPMPNYEAMTTPERVKELEKYGLKPLKRKRAIQLLTHIYNQTHPTIESLEGLQSPSKRFKRNTTPPLTPRKLLLDSTKNNLDMLENDCDIFQVTNETPEIKEIVCSVEDWVFQKREKAKVHSCRVPLHIAFHNYVSCRRGLREAILRYEPIEIDVIHKQLVGYGHRYDPKDLLKFMDKKCITVKTNDNSNRNK